LHFTYSPVDIGEHPREVLTVTLGKIVKDTIPGGHVSRPTERLVYADVSQKPSPSYRAIEKSRLRFLEILL
jgi:hypothetical protein